MATTPAQSLAQRHRQGQSDQGDALARLIEALWRTYVATAANPAAGQDAFVAAAVRQVRAAYARSALLARGYYLTARQLEGVRGPVDLSASPLAEDAVATSLAVTGFVDLEKRLEAGVDLREALDLSRDAAAGAAVRHGLNGGRALISDGALERDRFAVGYQRITREGCCYFCAALASRGPVYRLDSFDDSNSLFSSTAGGSFEDPRVVRAGEVKVHDRCRCGFQVIFKRSDAMPDRERAYADLWAAVARGKGDQMKRFRAAYEGRRYTGATVRVSS